MSSTSMPVALTRRRGAVRAQRVALVSMPFTAFTRPSIQIALLKAIADRAGHAADTFHLYVDFVRMLCNSTDPPEDAVRLYTGLADQRVVFGDWLFADEAFGEDAPDPFLMIDDQLSAGKIDLDDRDALLTIRKELVPEFLDEVCEANDWSQYDVVGFTSTFQQNAASFALARRLKGMHPDLTVVFGGANFDAVMGEEWVRTMPFIDYAIRGEADDAFPAFLDTIGRDESPLGIPGVTGVRDGQVVGTPPVQAESLETSPTPDYSEYFERLAPFGLGAKRSVTVPFESARGCWWGERRHCTFCGLNGETMEFRSKSEPQVVNQLTEMALRHRVLRFNAVDNIVDMAYFDRLLPELARIGRPFRLFYETKADLDRAQMEMLVRAGVDDIQPGIESLSSRVLQLMRKGTRAAWNVNLLRWGRHYGIATHWNLIWGFPGETPEDTEEQRRFLPSLFHLPPPSGSGRVWMERFSPMFNETDRFPTTELRPSKTYRFAYPDRVDFDRAAYFFDYHLDNTLADEVYEPLGDLVDEWNRLARLDEAPSLTVDDRGDHLVIDDRRVPDAPVLLELDGAAATLHRACMDHWRLRRDLVDELGLGEDGFDAARQELDDARLLFNDGALHVALALPATPAEVVGRTVPVGRACDLRDYDDG